MAMQQIGLEAILDLKGFNKGMSGYLSSLSKATSQTEKAAGGMGKSFTQLGGLATKAAAVMGGAIVAGAAAGAAAIGSFAVSGIRKAADLEAQISGIAAVLNKSVAEVAPLKQLILDLAVDPNLKVTAGEAAAAVEMLARNGLDMTAIMGGAAKATVLLANATGADFGVAADIATDAMAIFGIEAGKVEEAVNGIVGVTTSSKFTINDYALALAQGGGVAGAVGVSFNDFNASIAAISPLFASGSDAGTSYKTMLQRLTPQSKEAQNAIKELGLEFFNADGSMKSMAEISEELNRAFQGQITTTQQVGGRTAEQQQRYEYLGKTITGLQRKLSDYNSGLAGVSQSEADKAVSVDRLNRQLAAAQAEYAGLAGIQGTLSTSTRQLTEEERIHYATVIFGSDAMRSAFAMADAGAVVYTDLATASAETGLSQEILNQYMEDGALTAFELLQAQQSLTDANASAATRVDNLKGAMEIFWSVVESLQIQIGDKFLPVLTQVVRIFTDLVAKHTPAIIAAFGRVADAISSTVDFVIALITRSDNLREKFEQLPGPMQAIVAGLGGLGLIIDAVVQSISNTVGQFVKWQDVMIVVAGLIAATVVPIIGGLIAAAAPLIATFLALVGAVALVRTAWERDWLGIQTTVTGAIDGLKNAFTPLGAAIKTFGAGALTEIKAFATGNKTEFTNLKAIWDAAKVSFSTAFEGIKSWVAANLPAFQATLAQWGTAASQWITSALPVVAATMASWWATIRDYVAGQLPVWVATLTSWATAAWQWIGNAATQVKAKLGEWWEAIRSYVTGQWPTWVATLTSWATAAWQWIQAAALAVRPQLVAWWEAIRAYVDGQLAAWKTTLTAWATAAWQWIVDAAGQIPAKLGEWYTSISTNLANKLPAFKSALLAWRDAAWQWIVDAAAQIPGKISEWYADLKEAADNKLPAFRTTMLTWATALVMWIGSNAANALPELGKWLGRLAAWIPLGALALATSMLKMAGALIGWIAGGDNVSEEESAAGQTDEAMEAFKTALVAAVEGIKAGFIEAVQAFVDEWKTTMTENADWEQVGQNILNAVRQGIEAVRDALYNGIVLIVNQVKRKFTEIDWNQLGQDVLTWIKDGVNAAKDALVGAAKGIVDDLKKKFTDIDWSQLGKDIIDGILKGLKDNASKVLDYMKDLAKNALGSVTSLLGIESPSKAFWQVGKSIIDGWILGLQQNYGRLRGTVDGLVGGIMSQVIGSRGSVMEGLGQKAGDLLSVADKFVKPAEELLSRLDKRFMFPSKIAAVGNFEAQKAITESLQDQVDLVNFIRQHGGDVRSFLQIARPGGGMEAVQLGRNADPLAIVEVMARATAQLNEELEKQLRIATNGYDKLIDDLRRNVLSVEQIEQGLQRSRLRGLEGFRDRVLKIDEQIVNAETQLLNTGHSTFATILQELHANRRVAAEELRQFIIQSDSMTTLMGRIDAAKQMFSGDDRATRNAEDFIKRTIQPLIEAFNNPNFTGQQRAGFLEQIQANLTLLGNYNTTLKQLTATQERFGSILAGDFGDTIARNIQPAIDALHQIGITPQRRHELLSTLENYRQRVTGVVNSFENLRRTENVDGLADRVLQPMLNRLLNINLSMEERNRLQTEYSNALNRLRYIEQRDVQRASIEDRLDLMQRIRKLAADLGDEGVINQILGGRDLRQTQSAEDMMQIMAGFSMQQLRLAQQQLTQAVTLKDLTKEFDAIAGRSLSFEKLMQQFDRTPVALDERVRRELEFYDARIASLRELAAAGNQSALVQVEKELLQRDRWVGVLRTYMDALYRTDMHMQRIQTATSEQANQIAEKFRKDMLDPVLALIHDSSISEAMRATAVTNLGARVDQLNAFVRAANQADAHMGRIQESVNERAEETISKFHADMIEPLLKLLRNPNLSSGAQAAAVANLGARVDQLNAFIRTTNQYANLQKDVSKIVGFNPLIARFQEERLDAILKKMYDINTSEAERVQLAQQYNAEQNKLLALQEKQRQLTFLQEQLAIFEQLEGLRKENKWLVNMDEILRGIRFGLDASLDDMVTLTSRMIDAMVRVVKHDLGISSPSTVFQEIGESMADGLANGFESVIGGVTGSVSAFVENAAGQANAIISDMMARHGRMSQEEQSAAIDALRAADPANFANNYADWLEQFFARRRDMFQSDLDRFGGSWTDSLRSEYIRRISAIDSYVMYDLPQQRNLTVNMGGVTINNGMDEVMFEAQIRQIVESEF